MRFQQLSYTITGARELTVPTHLEYNASASSDELMRYFRLIYDETKDDVVWSTGGHTLTSGATMSKVGDNVFIVVTFISGNDMWDLTGHKLTIAMDYGESPHDLLNAIESIDTYVEIPDADMDKIFEGFGLTYYDQGGGAYSGSNASALLTTHLFYQETTLVDGVKAGSTFGGWYTTSDCSSSVITKVPEGIAGDIILYAKWN